MAFLKEKLSFQRDKTIIFILVSKMRKAAIPNGHWISDVSVAKTSSKEFTVTMSPAKCGDNLPLLSVVGAQNKGDKDDASFNFTEFGSSVRIKREKAASPPLTGIFDISQLNTSVKGKIKLKKVSNGMGNIALG